MIVHRYYEDLLVSVPPTAYTLDGFRAWAASDAFPEHGNITFVRKDTQLLISSYHQAGVREYWLIDARGDDLQFTIFHNQPEGYVAAEAVDA